METTLHFETISDSRFDENPENYIKVLVERIKHELDKLEGVHYVIKEPIKYIFDDKEGGYQYRAKFYIQKDGRKTTWNDVYAAINKVRAAHYTFLKWERKIA